MPLIITIIGKHPADRIAQRSRYPVSKEKMIARLLNGPHASLGGESLTEISTMDGVKYIFSDDSWLLIRPSGTEPVLRVYAEGRTPEMVKELLNFGSSIADSVS